jgi:ABC-type Fe3+-siderophore transport system permease subunit
MNNNKKFTYIFVKSSSILLIFSFIILNIGINFDNQKLSAILLGIRTNQLLGAIFIGSGLAIVGTVLQTYFNNSLASPHTLGLISLAGVGAAISIIFHLSKIYQFGFAFGGALILFLLISFSKIKDTNIIFIGIFLNFLGDSLIMWIKYLYAKIEDYASIDYWFWGSLEKITDTSLWWILVLIVPMVAIIIRSSTFLDLISQGMELQKNMSSNLYLFKRHEKSMILMSSIIIAIATITTGKIGFIGLMAPHISKKVGYGFEHKRMLIISALIGANILVISLFLQILLKNVGIGKFPIGLILSLPGVMTLFYILRGKQQ